MFATRNHCSKPQLLSTLPARLDTLIIATSRPPSLAWLGCRKSVPRVAMFLLASYLLCCEDTSGGCGGGGVGLGGVTSEARATLVVLVALAVCVVEGLPWYPEWDHQRESTARWGE